MPDVTRETAMAALHGAPVAGVDEVGRGPLAGPVTACAAILPDPAPPDLLVLLDDSKKLTAARRLAAEEMLKETARYAIADIGPEEIDRINILQAALLAMRQAVNALRPCPKSALVDGNKDPLLGIPTELVVKGDSLSASIAAASILAKCHRDRIMARLAEECPGYGWERNAGYASAAHRAALAKLGPTAHHRRSFAPLRGSPQSHLPF